MNPKTQKEFIFIGVVLAILVGSAVLNVLLVSDISDSVAQNDGAVPAGAYVVHVVGHQWSWDFYSPNGSLTVNTFTVPVNTQVALIVNSSDVIHDLAIPELGIQVYAVPGMNNTVVFEATHTGSFYFDCVEYCGELHYEMRGTLQVVSQ
ncbi:MAG: cytochrome c oxidase subunit II [Candidatus Thermoplasmatota archaeon]|nr:cytochrome c oxidase subunit II [Candidatus Thermoplasmatota archaeon]